MKDIIIRKSHIMNELRWLLVCFLISFSLNVIAIMYYETKWIELLTTIHVTMIMAGIFYFLVSVVRATYKIIVKINLFFR